MKKSDHLLLKGCKVIPGECIGHVHPDNFYSELKFEPEDSSGQKTATILKPGMRVIVWSNPRVVTITLLAKRKDVANPNFYSFYWADPKGLFLRRRLTPPP